MDGGQEAGRGNVGERSHKAGTKGFTADEKDTERESCAEFR